MLLDGKIGCRVCKTISNIDMFHKHGVHFIKEWINCQISSDVEKSMARKQHRKKIVKDANSKVCVTLTNFSWKEENN